MSAEDGTALSTCNDSCLLDLPPDCLDQGCSSSFDFQQTTNGLLGLTEQGEGVDIVDLTDNFAHSTNNYSTAPTEELSMRPSMLPQVNVSHHLPTVVFNTIVGQIFIPKDQYVTLRAWSRDLPDRVLKCDETQLLLAMQSTRVATESTADYAHVKAFAEFLYNEEWAHSHIVPTWYGINKTSDENLVYKIAKAVRG